MAQLVLHARRGRTHLLQINDNHLFYIKIVVFFVDVVLKGNTTKVLEELMNNTTCI